MSGLRPLQQSGESKGFDNHSTGEGGGEPQSGGGGMDGVLSPASFWFPEALVPSAWHQHAPFAFWLMETLRPRVFVELGCHHGFSYLAFCQAVRRLRFQSQGFAIDTWEGDEHAGFYGSEVFERLSAYHDPRYGDFSRLVRSTFDEARKHLGEASIDLLHIDGLHSYEDVKHDFETWRSKLARDAIVLFHDTNVRERGFGVAKLWSELRSALPGFEFTHGNGLGVLGTGDVLPDGLRKLFAAAPTPDRIREIYARLGVAIEMGHSLDMEVQRRREVETDSAASDANLAGAIARAEKTASERDQAAGIAAGLMEQAARLQADVEESRSRLAQRDDRIIGLARALATANERMGGLVSQRDTDREALNKTIRELEQSLKERTADLEILREANHELNHTLGERDDLIVELKQLSYWRSGRLAAELGRRVTGLPRQLGKRFGGKPRHKAISKKSLRQWAETINISGVFEPHWYRNKYPDVANKGIDPLLHYLKFGVREGRDPAPFFDTDWYLAKNRDVAATGVNPLVHYLRHGAGEGRKPSPFAESSRLPAQRPDIVHSNAELPLRGTGLPQAPAQPAKATRPAKLPSFETQKVVPGEDTENEAGAAVPYLPSQNSNGGMAPSDRTNVRSGQARSAATKPLLSLDDLELLSTTNAMLESQAEALAVALANATLNAVAVAQPGAQTEYPALIALLDELSRQARTTSPDRAQRLNRKTVSRAKAEFDAHYYLEQNPDVAATGIDPFDHFLQHGWREGRTPARRFSSTLGGEHSQVVWTTDGEAVTTPDRRGAPSERDRGEDRSLTNSASFYVPLLNAGPLAKPAARVIAFYLPQFHPIAENDASWGRGFTEWTRVRAARPQFAGHYQPRIPGELGYYNLLDPAVQHRQIELAKLYGIEGFCFYFYWFGGKRLLERPIERWLNDDTFDLPFCLCWANENWTRRWDGLDHEILVEQHHSPEDDLAFIAEVARYMRDPRYIRVGGRPLLIVYRPGLLPTPDQTARRWRTWCRQNDIGEIHLAYTQSFESLDPAIYGFDAAIEFPPNNSGPPRITDSVVPFDADFSPIVYDWGRFADRSRQDGLPPYKLFRAVCPGWDNTSRRKKGGAVFVNNSPPLYRAWLENLVEDARGRFAAPDERLIFVNAWNEWAEGAYLEPDTRFGYAWLQATRDALSRDIKPAGRRVVVVSHDAHPHGAQYTALNVARTFRDLAFEVDLVLLGDGPLIERFEDTATVHRIDLVAAGEAAAMDRLAALRRGGAEVAIANTTVSGLLVPLLKRAGFDTVSLVHELPGILASYKLHDHARAIAEHADKVVFPAAVVRSGFERFIGREVLQAAIRPQGLPPRAVIRKDSREGKRRRFREKLGLSADAEVVLGVGYADHRKGLDLFVETCIGVLRKRPRSVAVWVGGHDPELLRLQCDKIGAAGLDERFIFVGLVSDPEEVSSAFAAADVFALTSREDPFPTVVLEAAEAGLPVVAFRDAGGFSELLERGCGVLVAAFDTRAMAEVLGQLIGDPESAHRLGETGRDIVGSEFSFLHYVRDLMAFAGRPLPSVSVVVPNYNYARYLAARLSSIANQTVVPYELIVLDDASSDGSVAIIEDFLGGCAIPSRLLVNQANSGSVFQQWQRGVELARGEFVWIAEADDLADPGFIDEVLSGFAEPQVVMSFCQSRQMDDAGKIVSDHYLDYVADIDPKRWTASYRAEGREEIAKALYLKNTIPNVSAVLFRRDALAAVLSNYSDEIAALRHAGDWMTYLRLLEKGGIAFSAQSLNSHRRHAASVTVGNFNMRQLQEIVRIQRETIGRHSLGVEARERADIYSQRLYEQFGLASPEHPRFDTNPELNLISDRGVRQSGAVANGN